MSVLGGSTKTGRGNAAAVRKFSSTAAGLAAVASGEQFYVSQPFGEGVDVYLNVAGVATWQRAVAVEDLALDEVASRLYAFPVAPACFFLSPETAIQNGRGSRNTARPRNKVKGRNLYAFPHSPRQAGSGPTVALYAAAGPGTVSCTTVDCSTTAQIFSLWTSTYRPPAGTYGVRFKIRTNDGNAYAMRFGSTSPGPYATGTIDAAGTWLTVEKDVVTDGTNWSTFQILGDGTNTPKFRIAEVQIYEGVAASAIPAFSTENHGDDAMPPLAWPKQRHRAGRILDNTASTVEGAHFLRNETFPATTVFPEITMVGIGGLDAAATNQQLITTDQSTELGTTNATLAITSAQADGAPDFTGVTALAHLDMVGGGLYVLGLRIRDGQRYAMVDNFEFGEAASAFAGITARGFRVGANGTSETAFQNTFKWNGGIGGGGVFKKNMSVAEWEATLAAIKARMAAYGVPMANIPAVLIAYGDSQNASFSGARGPCFSRLQLNTGKHSPNLLGRVLAVGGATVNDIKTLQLPKGLQLVDDAGRAVRKAINIGYSGTNDQAAIAADGAGFAAQTLADLIDPMLARGPHSYVVWLTLGADGSGTPPAGFETGRANYNAALIAAMATRPRLRIVNTGADAFLGDPAQTHSVYFDTDFRHWSTLGHSDRVDPLVTPEVNWCLAA